MPEQSPTEARNPRTVGIDTVGTQEIIGLLQNEDAHAVEAASAASDRMAAAVDGAGARLRRGGRVHYFGAGASGRLAVLDATEVTPTFGADPELFTAHFPGGPAALADSTLDLEDADTLGERDAGQLRPDDVAVGVTASGSTAYVAGALRAARRSGALRVLITCNPQAALLQACDLPVVAHTGPEAITGSTRLKAGTATKVLLNSFSTALMVGAGRTYSNLMVGLVATNDKLRERSVGLLVEASGQPRERCAAALEEAGGGVEAALVSLLAGTPVRRAHQLLAEHGGVRAAVAALEEG
ncbi:N-acetylmuramic acid 6-phosphate etherase [Nocardiopsis kunsanensis]|uniref:N-acetylmuramic acid 6-phosphate etherase n=1 Tax=Nocardiopsis kunsanensis TaxID=141693 RepID=A0A919CJG5_9ACTN|nr:N-acetylmuramic acid 6-phosphate etherase [Nocardiopsis kunsanensis]GHD29889.1 N-acetylmuramic acid 6-phosphate etherase [Nocardiopsis kunsanensis]